MEGVWRDDVTSTIHKLGKTLALEFKQILLVIFNIIILQK